MGAFYYPSMEPAYPYIFYASAEEGLKAAIELAEKLRDTYDEIYLVDPNINFHISQSPFYSFYDNICITLCCYADF